MDATEYPVVLAGDIDYARKDELDAIAAGFESAAATNARVDMREVTFLDSRGLSFLVHLRNAADARGGHVEIVSPPERVTDLLRLVNLDGRFLISEGSP